MCGPAAVSGRQKLSCSTNEDGERSVMIVSLNKDLDMTLTLCHSVSLCMCVCLLGGDVLPPSCCYVMTSILASSLLSTGGVIYATQPSACCWLLSENSDSYGHTFTNMQICTYVCVCNSRFLTSCQHGHIKGADRGLSWTCLLLCRFLSWTLKGCFSRAEK